MKIWLLELVLSGKPLPFRTRQAFRPATRTLPPPNVLMDSEYVPAGSYALSGSQILCSGPMRSANLPEIAQCAKCSNPPTAIER